MRSFRSGRLRLASLVLVALAVTACGSGGASAAPASNAAPASGVPALVSAPAGSQAAVAGSPASSGGSSVCAAGLTSGHMKYTLNGFEAWHMCGPATATVTVGGTTVHISSGSCTTPTADTYAVAIGTQVFGSPPSSIEPDFLNIYIVAADGKTDPGGVVNHAHWLIIGTTINFGGGKLSGTFSGSSVGGGAVTGSFTCQ
jgi:hypothetical protein